jgi:hypothetical protein
MQLTDENGNVVEAMSPEEVAKLEEKAKQADELAEKIAKLEAKDMNFSKFREKTAEEQEKFKEKMSAEQRMLLDEVVHLRTEREAERKSMVDSAIQKELDRVAKGDEKLQESLKARMSQFAGEVKSAEEAQRRVRNAYVLEQSEKPGVNPMFGFSPVSGFFEPSGEKPDYVKTEAGKELYKKLFNEEPK